MTVLERGYLYASPVRQIARREGEAIADVKIHIEEDKPYYVGRIEFSGNTATDDKVLRREVRLNEGDLFNRTMLDLSKTKLNQLGYFEVQSDPAVEPVEGENRVKITFHGEEKERNEIQVGGGYSGLDGAFFTGYYSTRNFLGKGEIVSLSAQIGGRTDTYSLQFLEPWFLNRPYSLGFNIYRSDVDYGGSLRSSGRGMGVRVGRLFHYFLYTELAYDWENVTTTGFVGGAPAENRISSITPSVNYNRVNNPYRASKGWSLSLRAQYAGGFLVGDTSFFRPVVRFSGYRRATKRTFFGFHAEAGMITPVSDSVQNTATVFGVPRSQRFWLGGGVRASRFETRRSRRCAS
jgi:outer membrane protein insertion porin family